MSKSGSTRKDSMKWLICRWYSKVAFDPEGHPISLTTRRAFDEDSSKLSASFYVREDDSRARILCKVQKSRRSNKYYCLPLNMLEVRRVGSSLQLCRRRRSGTELVPWATLKFHAIESEKSKSFVYILTN